MKSHSKRMKSQGNSLKRILLVVIAVAVIVPAGLLIKANRNKTPDSAESGNQKSADTSFSVFCSAMDANKLKDLLAADSVELIKNSVYRTETAVAVQENCNFIVKGGDGVAGTMTISNQESKLSGEEDKKDRDNYLNSNKNIKDSEKIDNLGDGAYLIKTGGSNRLAVLTASSKLSISYSLPSRKDPPKDKLIEVAKYVIEKQ